MTIVVSAFPCLGKTTLTNKRKDLYFNAEIYESRATKNMGISQQREFFRNHARNIQLIQETNTYKCIFVTDDVMLIEELNKLGIYVIYVATNVNNPDSIVNYRKRVISRSGVDWYNRVLKKDMVELPYALTKIVSLGNEVRFVNSGQYIEHVVNEIL